MSFVRYYLGQFNLSPRWDPRCEDVLSVAFSVDRIEQVKGPRDRNYFYVFFSQPNFRYVLDVMRVFRANGILGVPCFRDIRNKNGEVQKTLFLRVRARVGQFTLELRDCDAKRKFDIAQLVTGAGVVGRFKMSIKTVDYDAQSGVVKLVVEYTKQSFIVDVHRTIENANYYRDVVLPAYNAEHSGKKYHFPELFGPYSR